MKVIRTVLSLSVLLGLASPAAAQFGLLEQGAKRAKQVSDFNWSDEEKAALGQKVSELVRQRYGVVQDPAVHKYVTLVGRTVTEKSTKPGLPWTFIVLDTDAVNAFAAPHGYVHITRGALALMKDESELAGVLAHEIVHVAEEHTIDALKKNTLKSAAAEQVAGGNGLIEFLANAAYNNILDNAYSRGDEGAADTQGITLISKAGYAPQGLGSFLTTLADRNKSATEKRGLFSSHPEMQARQDKLTTTITKGQLAGTQLVADRYKATIKYKPVPQSQIATVAAGTKGLAGGSSASAKDSKSGTTAKADPPQEAPKKKGFGLGKLVSGGGSESKSAQVVGSGGARGLDPEKDAKGGGNPAVVAVKVTPADLQAFKKAGSLT
ncbi:M48 family metalloprotease [Luteitalea sp.]|uniref:M48 family metalloprotease n=1 Tax=Luteitalea sp. TaxID=2004800 RepID=UPI0025C2DD1A|nr:M48 family metalloprotease [Luteitalea sp.]